MLYRYSQTIEIEINIHQIDIYTLNNEQRVKKESYTKQQLLLACKHSSPNQWAFNGLDLNLAKYIINYLLPLNETNKPNEIIPSLKEHYLQQGGYSK